MELMKNLQWICRVCTVNIKKRRSLVPVQIFETPQLCEKIKKYLFLEPDPDDELPKMICGNCHRKIEAFHNFASLATRSDIFLKDFVNIAKGNVLGIRTPQAINDKYQKEFASFALLAEEKGSKNESINNDDLPVNDAGELILNVSVNDPLIKDIENKIDLATKRRSLEIEHRKTKRGNSTKKNGSSSSGRSNDMGEGGGGGGKKRNSDGSILTTQNKSKSLSGNFLKSNNNQNINNGIQLIEQQRTYSDGNFSGTLSPFDSKKLIQQQQQISPTVPSNVSYDVLNLGSVIKDMDLLKLILKALKWPYTKDSLSIQIQRLKNTRLRDVITDPNLLQDTDMTQILRSYLSPVLLQSHNNNTSTLNIMNSTAAAINTLSSIMSYKIPADTSVQLISVPSSEANNTSYHSYHHHHNLQQQQQDTVTTTITRTTKVHRMSTSPSPIILSDDSNDNDVQLFEVSVDPRLYFPGDKEFFFHQYNNTESLSENPPTTKSAKLKTENPKTRVRKKHRKREIRNNNLKSKRNTIGRRQTQRQQKKQQQQQQQQLLQQKEQQQQQQQQQEQQDVIVIDDNPSVGTSAARNRQKPAKSTKIIQDEGFKDFNIDSITLIEEASGDDEVWAEFKVTESPENSDTENHNKEIINIKKEAVDDIEISSSIKSNDNSKVNENDKNEETINKTTNSKKEIQNEELSNKITGKESNTSNTENIIVKKEMNEPTKRKYTRKNANQKTRNYPTSSRVTRPKSPRNYFNKRKQNRTESKRLRLQTENKKEEKSVEKETVVSSRKSNARKRICKQCGLTFTNITDFVEHRKKHM